MTVEDRRHAAAATRAKSDPDVIVTTGMPWKQPQHLYLKRAKADQIELGTPGRHRARLGTLMELPC
ncbi:hypothetical protein GCM10009838_51570 [Catenulispora subtropica]|uniref:Uncharacterized protein n=1 Tax=Catenulispora subtropica TaxID=450798 RepID=A0ABN2SAV7_9ACTN